MLGLNAVVINITTRIAKHNYVANIIVYPNPTKGMIKLEWPREAELQIIDVYDAFGKLIQNIAIETNSIQTQINLKELAKEAILYD